MSVAEEGILLNLLQDEKIVYKTRAGRLSFLGYLPASTIVVTNKRLFVFGKFRSIKSFFYDKISSVDVKRGVLMSKFLIKTQGLDKPSTVVFYKSGVAVSMFSIVSNQISASIDPNFANKEKAHVLESRYNVLTTRQKGSDVRSSHQTLATFARTEQREVKQQKKLKVEDTAQEILQTIQQVQEVPSSELPRATKQYQLSKRIAGFKIAVAQHIHIPKQSDVNYYAAGKAFTLNGHEQEPALPKSTSKKIDPDSLHIFKVRKMRGEKIEESRKLNPFNILNSKQ